MGKKPSYVYDYKKERTIVKTIFLGLIRVQQAGYEKKIFSFNWKRIGALSPIFAVILWVASAEIFYFRERYMNGITTSRRGDAYLYFPDSIINSLINSTLSKEEVGRRERRNLIAHDKEKSYGMLSHLANKGEFYFQRAKVELERKDFPRFARYIGTAAQLSPRNSEAQLLAAELYFSIGRQIDAFTILDNSLDFSINDPDHFNAYLGKCFAYDQDARIIACAKKFLGTKNLNPQVEQGLKIANTQAHFLRGYYTEAGNLIKQYNLESTPEGFLIGCQLLWENGDRQEAIKLISTAANKYPEVTRLLEIKAKWLKDMGDKSGARDCVDLIAIQKPDAPGPQIQLLYLITGVQSVELTEKKIDYLIKEYGKDSQTMLELAQYANDTNQPKLTKRLLDWANESRFPNRYKYILTHAECLINDNHARDAILLINDFLSQNERQQWLQDITIALDALRAIAYFADNQPEIASINLQRLLKNRNVPPSLLVTSARKLIVAKRYLAANNMLIDAHLANEGNQALLLEIVRLKIEHGEVANDVEVYLRRLMATRRPPKEMLAQALARISSDIFLFSENRDQLQIDIESMVKR